MSTVDAKSHDYNTGDSRRHHSLYLDDGNFVIQVEKAIFKVHRSILAKYSSVIEDMLNAPQGKDVGGGTDEQPLVLTGDSVVAWELLLGWQYESPRFNLKHALNGEQLLSILSIAHKYCMVKIEENILEVLHGADSTAGYVDLLVAAQIVGSDVISQKALDALKTAEPKPDPAQAKRIGVEATYIILTSRIPVKLECQFCSDTQINMRCGSCKRWQNH